MGDLSATPGGDRKLRLTMRADSRSADGVWNERLRAFRASHEPRTLKLGAFLWPHLIGGQGERAALLLHGSHSDGESLFGLMGPLERSWRTIAPTYPDGVESVTDLVDGLVALLNTLDVASALVVGYSLGGYLAQALAWRYPKRVAGLALFHTGAPTRDAARSAALQNTLLAAVPGGVIRAASGVGVASLLAMDAPGLQRGEARFWQGYLTAMARRVGKRRMLAHGRMVVDFLSGPAGIQPLEGVSMPPALIVHAARDHTIERSERRALDALYPHATRALELETGHLSALTRPERYVAAIQAAYPSLPANA